MNHPSAALQRHWQHQQNEEDAHKYYELQRLSLFNEKSFYREFEKDLLNAKKEVVIYSPFVTKYRSDHFRKILKELQRRNIAVFIFTRALEEHENIMKNEVRCALRDYEDLGATVICLSGYVHAKAAIIDRTILWEGSLNILSQRRSHEMMRRIADEISAKQVMTYLDLNAKIADGYRLQYEKLYQGLIARTDRSSHYRKMFWYSMLGLLVTGWLILVLRVTIGPLKEIVGILNLLNTPIR